MLWGGETVTLVVARALIILGFGLWAWGWFKAKTPILRQRFHDCGTTIVIAATLALYFVRDRELHFMDWLIVVLGPLFIAIGLWRLFRTQPHIEP